jgi:hypothetical protein
MKPKIDPLFLSNSKGEKLGVLLKVEEFEEIMKQLESLDAGAESKEIHKKVQVEVVSEEEKVKTHSKKKKTKLVFGKTEAELDFEKTEAAMDLEKAETEAAAKPNNFYTKSIITKPVHFEMQDEFCSAKGILLADGKNFRVLKGSKASWIVDKDLPKNILSIREELKMLQVLEDDPVNGDMVFTRNYEFDNPSDAASAIAASPRDGSHCWIAVENGKPMRQY